MKNGTKTKTILATGPGGALKLARKGDPWPEGTPLYMKSFGIKINQEAAKLLEDMEAGLAKIEGALKRIKTGVQQGHDSIHYPIKDSIDALDELNEKLMTCCNTSKNLRKKDKSSSTFNILDDLDGRLEKAYRQIRKCKHEISGLSADMWALCRQSENLQRSFMFRIMQLDDSKEIKELWAVP